MVENNIHRGVFQDQTVQGVVIQQGDSSIGTNEMFLFSVTSHSQLIYHQWRLFMATVASHVGVIPHFRNTSST